jgi:hypothetical protein
VRCNKKVRLNNFSEKHDSMSIEQCNTGKCDNRDRPVNYNIDLVHSLRKRNMIMLGNCKSQTHLIDINCALLNVVNHSKRLSLSFQFEKTLSLDSFPTREKKERELHNSLLLQLIFIKLLISKQCKLCINMK